MSRHSKRRSEPAAKKNDTTNLTELLLRCMGEADPMLSMLEWLCAQLMEAEVSSQLGAEKNEHSDDRTGSRSGYRPRRYDTRMGTMYRQKRRLYSLLCNRTQTQ
jgi:putative transposase